MTVEAINQTNYRVATANIGLKNVLLDDYTWSKEYSPETDTVDIRSKVALDAGNYTIKNDGTVISGINLGQPQPIVILNKNENLAAYVKNMKEQNGILNKIIADVSFTGNETKAEEVSEVENAIETKKPKSARNSVASLWKFMTTANQMANSALKGLFYGALTGVALLGGSWIFKALPKAFTKEGPTLWNTIRHPLKNIGKSGKVIAGIGSAAVLGYQLVAGRLAANEKTAVIDHKLKTGHRDK